MNNSNPLCAVEPRETQSKVNITYGKYYQGEIGFEHEISASVLYLPLHSALMNTFTSNNYAVMVLKGYLVALLQGLDSALYVFDSHSRNSVVMPDSDGTAVLMKISNVLNLE